MLNVLFRIAAIVYVDNLKFNLNEMRLISSRLDQRSLVGQIDLVYNRSARWLQC